MTMALKGLCFTYNLTWCSNQLVVSKVRYLLVLDVNELLCAAKHLKSTNIWKPFIYEVRCGNILASPSTNSIQFWSCVFHDFTLGFGHQLTTWLDLIPMVDFLLRDSLGLKLVLFGVMKSVMWHIIGIHWIQIGSLYWKTWIRCSLKLTLNLGS
jgi:hypothetical protein